MTEYVVIPVVCVFLGWLLSQLSGKVTDILKIRRIKKGIVDEMSDIESFVSDMEAICLKHIEMYAAGTEK